MINKRLLSLAGDAKRQIVRNVLFQWLSMLSGAALTFGLGWFIQLMSEDRADISALWCILAVFTAAVLLRVFCGSAAGRASFRAGSGVKKILRQTVYEKLLCLGPSYIGQTATSEVVQVATEGVDQTEVYFSKYLPQLFYSVLAPTTLFLLLAPVYLPAAVCLLLCVPLIPLTIVAVQKLAKRLLARYWSAYAGLGDSFLENLQGLTTLKIYRADGAKQAEMNREAEHFRKITMKVLSLQLNSIIVMDLIAYGGSAAGMILSAGGYAGGAISLGDALTIALLSAEFFLPMRLLGSYFHIAMNGMAAIDKLFHILDLKEPKKSEQSLPKGALSVVFRDVSFFYEAHRPVLKNIVLEAVPGRILSLTGGSGSGKSTLAALVTGQLRGYTGSIALGGVEVSMADQQQLSQRVTLVSSAGYLFAGTIGENLRMALPNAGDDELWQVLEEVCLAEFLQARNGLETRLSERGANFSGGQRQRLCLARALLRDSDLYVFDEATSNVDAESEALIMATVTRLAERKTVILISHRLSNLINTSCICLMKSGTIMERGTHEELLENGGDYAVLFREQEALERYGNTVEYQRPAGRKAVAI
ncbi:MAG: cysteine transporter ATP-binding protein [Oscillospiraceae bacterium]|nr:cysteine transporter ATP-binding protein [Oscillospiraceae bacterium]